MNFVDIVFASLLANHLLFFHFLGLGEFLTEGGTQNLVRRTLALTALLVLASLSYWLGDHFLLQPWHFEFLRTLLLLAVLWVVTTLWAGVRKMLTGAWPVTRDLLVHSFLVGGVLLIGSSSSDWAEVLATAIAASIGYGGALVLLVAVYRRLARDVIPSFIQGLPLQLLTLGMVWLVLHGLGFAFAGTAS